MPGDTVPPYDSLIQPPPGYNREPLRDEQILASTPRPGLAPIIRQSAKFVKCFKDAIVIFTDQEENIATPTYSRGAVVSGEIGLTSPENVLEVTIKLYGHMSMMAADWGSTGSTLVSDKQTLWSCIAARAGDKDTPCPSIMPFAIRIPSTYTSTDGKNMRMPPSFQASHFGIPAFFVKCTYSLSITITKTRNYKFASWTTSKTFTIALNYRPRTRPQRPVIVIDTVFASIKPVPEEWLQVVATTETRLGASGKPLLCHLLIPSVQTFAITDTIPFHVQLSGPVSSLQELIPPDSGLLKPVKKTSDSRDPYYYPSFPTPDSDGVRVRLVRQIVADINGRVRVRTLTIGTGKLDPIPPAITDIHVPDDMTLDWQGEVRCLEEVTCGGFNAHGLTVKDFLVLDLSPPRPSFMLPLQISQPIRLVTDSWTDDQTIHPQDI